MYGNTTYMPFSKETIMNNFIRTLFISAFACAATSVFGQTAYFFDFGVVSGGA